MLSDWTVVLSFRRSALDLTHMGEYKSFAIC
jgi:hypothetical protein